MKNIIFALSTITLAMASCSTGTLSATEYNQKAISIYNPLDAKISSVFNGFTPDATNKDKNIASINSCIKSIDSVKTELEKLKAPKEALPLHQALLNIVRYEKDSMMPLFIHLIDAGSNEEAIQKIGPETATMGVRAAALTKAMQDEQQKLAASMGAKLH